MSNWKSFTPTHGRLANQTFYLPDQAGDVVRNGVISDDIISRLDWQSGGYDGSGGMMGYIEPAVLPVTFDFREDWLINNPNGDYGIGLPALESMFWQFLVTVIEGGLGKLYGEWPLPGVVDPITQAYATSYWCNAKIIGNFNSTRKIGGIRIQWTGEIHVLSGNITFSTGSIFTLG